MSSISCHYRSLKVIKLSNTNNLVLRVIALKKPLLLFQLFSERSLELLDTILLLNFCMEKNVKAKAWEKWNLQNGNYKILQNIQTYHEIKGFPEFRIYNLQSKIISLEITSSFSRWFKWYMRSSLKCKLKLYQYPDCFCFCRLDYGRYKNIEEILWKIIFLTVEIITIFSWERVYMKNLYGETSE